MSYINDQLIFFSFLTQQTVSDETLMKSELNTENNFSATFKLDFEKESLLINFLKFTGSKFVKTDA